MTTVCETERLVVRDWTTEPDDLARVFDMYSRWEVVRFLGAQPRTMGDAAEAPDAVARWQSHSTDSGGRYGVWAIQERRTGIVAGSVLFKPLPAGTGEVEVGWHLHPDAQGHGYATEAARAVIARGFAAGLPEVYAVTYPENLPSQAVCRRLGMTALGRTERWYGIPVEAFVLVNGDSGGNQKSTTTGA